MEFLFGYGATIFYSYICFLLLTTKFLEHRHNYPHMYHKVLTNFVFVEEVHRAILAVFIHI